MFFADAVAVLRFTNLNVHLLPKLSDCSVDDGGAGFGGATHLATFYRAVFRRGLWFGICRYARFTGLC